MQRIRPRYATSWYLQEKPEIQILKFTVLLTSLPHLNYLFKALCVAGCVGGGGGMVRGRGTWRSGICIAQESAQRTASGCFIDVWCPWEYNVMQCSVPEPRFGVGGGGGADSESFLAGRALDLASGKESADAGDARDMGLIPGSGRSPQRKKWYTTPVFLPGKCHGQRSLVGYSLWSRRVGHDWAHIQGALDQWEARPDIPVIQRHPFLILIPPHRITLIQGSWS